MEEAQFTPFHGISLKFHGSKELLWQFFSKEKKSERRLPVTLVLNRELSPAESGSSEKLRIRCSEI